MADNAIITVEQLRDYLGVDADADGMITAARASAIERLGRATGVDWTQQAACAAANEAISIMVYIHFYAVRDDVKNTNFLERHLTSLIKTLQYSKEAIPNDA